MNLLSKILLFCLLGLLGFGVYLYFFVYKKEVENSESLVKQIEKKDQTIKDQKEDNIVLSNKVDSITAIKKQDSVRIVYKTKTVLVNANTNENIKVFYSTATDSTKISKFTELLTDTTFRKGSYNSSRNK